MEIVITSIARRARTGVGIGVLSGMLGIGGGTIMIPVLRLGYGLAASMATATSLFAIIPISLAGAVTHIRARSCLPKLGILLGVAGAVTSSAGVYLGSVSPAWLIMVVAAVIIIYSAFTMLSKAVRMGKKSSSKSGSARASASGTPSNIEPCTFGFTRKNVALAVIIGLIAGFASGYVGVGGGFIMVPLMTAWLGIPMKRTSGTSLIAIIILAIPGVIQQAFLGHIDYLAGIMLCVRSHSRRGARRPSRVARSRAHAALHLLRPASRCSRRARGKRVRPAVMSFRARGLRFDAHASPVETGTNDLSICPTRYNT